jgi:hypothetical protein
VAPRGLGGRPVAALVERAWEVYSFDSGSGYLGDRSGVGVVRQDFVLPFLNTGPIKRLRPREKLAFKRQSAPFVSPGPADACAVPYLY